MGVFPPKKDRQEHERFLSFLRESTARPTPGGLETPPCLRLSFRSSMMPGLGVSWGPNIRGESLYDTHQNNRMQMKNDETIVVI